MTVRTMSPHHDAFISYATVASGQLGAAVEHGLTTLGKPWDSPAAMDVFRDISDQPATADLAEELLTHLDGSAWLILLASPQAARSRWVRDEISHWLRTRGDKHILLGIADGEIGWDAQRSCFDPAQTTCLPPEMMSVKSMPKWVDFRHASEGDLNLDDELFFDKVADFSATIRGIPKERLVGLHWREYRKGLARRIAQHAALSIETDIERSLLLAVAANSLDDVPETRDTLATVLEISAGVWSAEGPHGNVTAMSLGTTPSDVVLGHADGAIDTLHVGDPLRHTLIGVPRPDCGPSALGVSEGGTVAGYADGMAVSLAPGPGGMAQVMAEPVKSILPDKSGARVACTSDHRVVIWDVESGELTELPARLTSVQGVRWDGGRLTICDWSELKRFDLLDEQLSSQGNVPFLARPGPRALNRRMDMMAVAQLEHGGVTLHSVPSTDLLDRPFVQAPLGFMDSLAVDDAGEHVAVATGGRLMMWSFSSPDTPLIDQHGLPSGVRQLLIGDGGSWIVALGRDNCQVRTARTSTLGRRVPVEALQVPSVIQDVIAVAFSPDSDVVAWIRNPRSARTWDPDPQPSIFTWRISSWSRGPSLDLSPRTPIGISFADPGRVRVEFADDAPLLWDLNASEARASVPSDIRRRTAVVLAQSVVIRDAETIVDEICWPELDSPLVCISESGRIAVLAFRQSGRLVLRDVEARTDIWSVATARFSAIACSANERMLAGVTSSGQLLLIDSPTGQISGRLRVDPSTRQRLAFAPSDLLLACAGVGGALTLVDIDPHSWHSIARIRAGRTMTRTELEELGLDGVYLP